MESKIRKVQRWLERCVDACKSRSWENALADMECAAAELESARKELWSVVDGSRARIRARRRSMTLGATATATIFVLMFAIPVTMPEPVRQLAQAVVWEDEKALLELITRDEKDLILSLRKSLSSSNKFDIAEAKGEIPAPDSISLTSLPAIKVASSKPMREEKNEAKIEKVEQRESIPLNEVVELLEIGQRALRKGDDFIVLEERKRN